jgi:hypothetical protein
MIPTRHLAWKYILSSSTILHKEEEEEEEEEEDHHTVSQPFLIIKTNS